MGKGTDRGRAGKLKECPYCGVMKSTVYRLYGTVPRLGWSRRPIRRVTLEVRVSSTKVYTCGNPHCINYGLYDPDRSPEPALDA